MLDCGIHPGLSGMDALPFVDLIEADEVDLLFISQYVSHRMNKQKDRIKIIICLLQFSFGSLWCIAMVFTKD